MITINVTVSITFKITLVVAISIAFKCYISRKKNKHKEKERVDEYFKKINNYNIRSGRDDGDRTFQDFEEVEKG